MSSDPYTRLIKKEYTPRLSALREDMKNRRDPHFFWPNGTQVYVGKQGSGKTSAAVQHCTIDLKARYPKAILVSNLLLTEYAPKRPTSRDDLQAILRDINPEDEYVFFSDIDELQLVLTGVNNGFHGVIYLVDEIHTYFNALESKNVEPWVFTEIAQQRKQRKLIIGTSQLFQRMAKPFREQASNIVFCRTLGGIFTVTTAIDGFDHYTDYDGKIHGDIKRRGWFWHTKRLRAAFDTYQKISSGKLDFETVPTPELNRRGKPLRQSKKDYKKQVQLENPASILSTRSTIQFDRVIDPTPKPKFRKAEKHKIDVKYER